LLCPFIEITCQKSRPIKEAKFSSEGKRVSPDPHPVHGTGRAGFPPLFKPLLSARKLLLEPGLK